MWLCDALEAQLKYAEEERGRLVDYPAKCHD
jgi:hypothetical protein